MAKANGHYEAFQFPDREAVPLISERIEAEPPRLAGRTLSPAFVETDGAVLRDGRILDLICTPGSPEKSHGWCGRTASISPWTKSSWGQIEQTPWPVCPFREVYMGKGHAQQCGHIKPGSVRCRANTRNGSKYCFFHDPQSAPARVAARKAGGVQRSRKAAVLPSDTPDKPLASGADVIGLFAETINQVRRGEVDPRISNLVGYLAGILLKARERAELEERVARLETIVAGQQGGPTPEFDLDADRETVEFVNPGNRGRP